MIISDSAYLSMVKQVASPQLITYWRLSSNLNLELGSCLVREINLITI
jgi:hypothetical protein